MPTDLTLPLKRMIIDHLASDPDVVALVPVEQIYAMQPVQQPVWPFIRFGSPISSPFEASCWDGSSTRVTLHAFAETTETYSGEDRAFEIVSAIVESMKKLDPTGYGLVQCEWLQTNCVRDEPEADKWHAWCEHEIILVK